MNYFIYADEEWPSLWIEAEPLVGSTLQGTIELTAEERIDYMRVEQEHQAWQNRIREKTRL